MDERQQHLISISAVVVLVAVAFWLFWPLDAKIRQALDIRGGLSVILTAKPGPGEAAPTADTMSRAETIVRNRVDKLGVSEASVQRQGGDSILVQLPGIKNPQDALKVLGSTGQLQFVVVESINDSAAVDAITANKQNVQLKPGTYKPILTGSVVTDARVGVDNLGKPTVDMTFNSEGTQTWGDFTVRNIKKRVAIVLDGTVKSAPEIQSAITDGKSQISGNFTAQEAKDLALVLQTGALPVTLQYSDSRVVGPTLGQQSLQQGLLAALVGLALVAVYMAIFYRGLGLLTWLSLGTFTALFLGILAVLSSLGAFALSLPGIAGMVLTVGLAADSSILILERFKEEVRMGKSYRSAAKSGTRHAIGTSVDADVVTFVSAIVLFLVAIGPVKGFALTLMLGIVCDLFVAILFTRSVLILLAESVIERAPGFFGMKRGDDRA